MRGTPSVTRSAEILGYCPHCVATVGAQERCAGCSGNAPAQGWPTLSDSPYQWLGKVLDDRYVLNRFLGQGAVGQVYRAQAVQIQREFAAKIVDTRRFGMDQFEEELARRFRTEVEVMSRLRNPHVVSVYEAMQLPAGVFVVIMELVNGPTLKELLKRVGRVKRDIALTIARQIANGLYEAHHLGMVHRDLKPENIMLERLPASGFFVKILDFGIVRVVEGGNATQGFRGTPLYASPEQCQGNPALDHRSDIYSLGCLLFHLLTGRSPFPGNDALRVMEAHVNQEPPRLKDVYPAGRYCDSIELLVRAMMAKDPEARPSSMSEVIKAIDGVLYEPQLEEHTNPFPPIAVESLSESTAAASNLVREIVRVCVPQSATGVHSIVAQALDSSSEQLMIADQAGRVHSINVSDGSLVFSTVAWENSIRSLYLNSRYGQILIGDSEGNVLAWDLKREKFERLFSLSDEVSALCTQSHGGIVIGTKKGRVIVFDVEKKTTQVLLEGGPAVSALTVSPRENRVIIGFESGRLILVDLHTKKRKNLDSIAARPLSIICSEDGYIAAVLDEEGTIRIISLVHGSSIFEVGSEPNSLDFLAFDKKSQLYGVKCVLPKLRKVRDSVEFLKSTDLASPVVTPT